MTNTDWIVDIALIAIVLRQIRESRLDARFFLIPFGLVGWSAFHFLRAVPTGGNDLVFIGGVVAAGALLGLASGAATRVRVQDGSAYVRAGVLAAGLWVLGTGTRLAFQLYATHGGDASIARFSASHRITSEVAWLDALILMALTEVVVRMGMIGLRARRGLTGAATARSSRSGRLVTG